MAEAAPLTALALMAEAAPLTTLSLHGRGSSGTQFFEPNHFFNLFIVMIAGAIIRRRGDLLRQSLDQESRSSRAVSIYVCALRASVHVRQWRVLVMGEKPSC